jgi:hypothetical protein
VPTQTRCPSCAAAVPSNAAWCSLCHADLRPAADPVEVSSTVVAVPSDDVAAPAPAAPSGRHAAPVPVVSTRPSSSGGRHAAGRSLVTSPAGPALPPPVLHDLEIPVGEKVTQDQVDALAEQMLHRLAATEPRDRLLDPRQLPGGVWAFSAACALGAVVLFVIVANILGLFLNR